MRSKPHPTKNYSKQKKTKSTIKRNESKEGRETKQKFKMQHICYKPYFSFGNRILGFLFISGKVWHLYFLNFTIWLFKLNLVWPRKVISFYILVNGSFKSKPLLYFLLMVAWDWIYSLAGKTKTHKHDTVKPIRRYWPSQGCKTLSVFTAVVHTCVLV